MSNIVKFLFAETSGPGIIPHHACPGRTVRYLRHTPLVHQCYSVSALPETGPDLRSLIIIIMSRYSIKFKPEFLLSEAVRDPRGGRRPCAPAGRGWENPSLWQSKSELDLVQARSSSHLTLSMVVPCRGHESLPCDPGDMIVRLSAGTRTQPGGGQSVVTVIVPFNLKLPRGGPEFGDGPDPGPVRSRARSGPGPGHHDGTQ